MRFPEDDERNPQVVWALVGSRSKGGRSYAEQMTATKRTVQLSDEQIAFIIASLDYSAERIRESAIQELDRGSALVRRRDYDEMITSIKQTLRDAN